MRSRDPLSPLQKMAADRLADEVAVLVTRGYLDSRSAAADALLDYRQPPRSPRSDRLAELENGVATERARIRKELLEWANPMVEAIQATRATAYQGSIGAPDSARLDVLTGLRTALDRILPGEDK